MLKELIQKRHLNTQGRRNIGRPRMRCKAGTGDRPESGKEEE